MANQIPTPLPSPLSSFTNRFIHYREALKEIETYLIECPIDTPQAVIIEHVGTIARKALKI
jgi:hypothetical protein